MIGIDTIVDIAMAPVLAVGGWLLADRRQIVNRLSAAEAAAQQATLQVCNLDKRLDNIDRRLEDITGILIRGDHK